MAKLYWRVKRDGKWKFVPAECKECEWQHEKGDLECCPTGCETL